MRFPGDRLAHCPSRLAWPAGGRPPPEPPLSARGLAPRRARAIPRGELPTQGSRSPLGQPQGAGRHPEEPALRTCAAVTRQELERLRHAAIPHARVRRRAYAGLRPRCQARAQRAGSPWRSTVCARSRMMCNTNTGVERVLASAQPLSLAQPVCRCCRHNDGCSGSAHCTCPIGRHPRFCSSMIRSRSGPKEPQTSVHMILGDLAVQ